MNTFITQGSFVSTGTNHTLNIETGFDWLEVTNYTQSIAQPGGGNTTAVKHYWQDGMPLGLCIATTKSGASDALLNVVSVAGSIAKIDSSALTLGASVSVTAGTNATQPVYSTASTAGLQTGSIVRVYGSDQANLNGKDFSIDTIVANTSFRLANTLATAPGVVAGANGYWKFVAPDAATYSLFYPSTRMIANITQATSAVVRTLVDHQYKVGQTIRFNVGAEYGMVEMNGLLGTVTAVTASTFTVNIDYSAFTAFAFPNYLNDRFTAAAAVPVGDIWTGSNVCSTANQGYRGVILGGGLAAVGAAANGPAGVLNDVIYWKAGKSEDV